MGGLFGRGAPNMSGIGPFQGIQVQTSVATVPVPIVYGQQRLSPNLIWYGNFQAHAGSGSGKGGAAGGGGKGAPSQTSYSADVIMGLCEGPIDNIAGVWVNKFEYQQSVTGLLLFKGSNPQTPWAYMTTNYPADALGYNSTAYMAASNYVLDSSAQLQNHTFDVAGFLQFTSGAGDLMAADPPALWYATTAYVVGNIVYGPLGGCFKCILGNTNQQPPNATYWQQIFPDANPAQMVPDLLESTQYGVGMSSAYMGDMTQYSDYCIANGLFLSAKLSGQESANAIIQRWMEITNSEAFWSDGLFKVTPRGDTVVTGNGVTFTPNLTPAYDLTDDNYIVSAVGAAPVKLTIADQVDAFNVVTINFCNRANQYNQVPIQVKDQVSVDLYGMRNEPAQSHNEICDQLVAQTSAQMRLQRIQSTRNVYAFTLPVTFCTLEPMDLLTLTDAALGLAQTLVRIVSVEEDEYGNLAFLAEEMMVGAAHPASFQTQQPLGYSVNYNAAPPNTNQPVFYVPPVEIAGNKLVGYLMVSGGALWGGCDVWVSSDNATYVKAGRIMGGTRMGALTAILPSTPDPDLTDTLSVDLTESLGTLVSVTRADADEAHSLCYVDGELVSYETATLTAANKYNLTYLRRGLYGSPIGAHAIGSQFARMDGSQFELDFTADQIGKTVYVKLPAFNPWLGGLQDLASVTAYPFTVIAPPVSSSAQPFSATIGLPAPSSVQVFATPDSSGDVSQIKVQFKMSVANNLVPDALALLVSVFDTPNQLGIVTDSGSSLTVDNAHILSSGTNTILAGSTTGYLVTQTATNPNPSGIPIGGMYWAQFGASQWRKVTSYDALGFYFNQPFDVAPTAGETLNYVEIAWFDERDPEYRMAAIVAGGQVEVVKWTTLTESGGVFSIGGLSRAQEGTTQINGSGGIMNYYPAPGSGTKIVVFDGASLTLNADGTYTGEANTNITAPVDSVVTIAAMTYRNTTAGAVRSPIVPATFGGAL